MGVASTQVINDIASAVQELQTELLGKIMFLRCCVVFLITCIEISLNAEIIPGACFALLALLYLLFVLFLFIPLFMQSSESSLPSRFVLVGEPTRWRINDTDISCNYSTSSDLQHPNHSFVYRIDNGKPTRWDH